MLCLIHPNYRNCPICGGYSDIYIEEDLIFCEKCTANFTDPKWADSAEDLHEVTFDGFEDSSAAAEVMSELATTLRNLTG